MSDTESDRCCLSDICYCFHGNNQNQTNKNWEIKEISNPLPLDYFLMADDDLKNSQRKVTATITRPNATFPRHDQFQKKQQSGQKRPATTVANQPADHSSIDKDLQLLRGLRNDTIYQEIVEEGNAEQTTTANQKKKPIKQIQNQNNMTDKKQEQLFMEFDDSSKNKINIKFLSSRIIVGYLSENDGANYSLMLKSLSNTYGKQIKKFEFSTVNSVDKLSKTQSIPTKDNSDPDSSTESSMTHLYSLIHVMPGLCEMYHFLNLVYKWLKSSRRHVILLVSHSPRCYSLLLATIKYLLMTDETSRRYFRKDSIILLDHEINTLSYFEKSKIEKYSTSSLNRYVLNCSNMTLKTTQISTATKSLHAVTIKYDLNAANRTLLTRIRQKHSNMPFCLDCDNKNNNNEQNNDDYSPNCTLQNIFLTIYQNFHLIYTTYKINIYPNIQPEKLIYLIDPVLPLNGDILIFVNATNKMGFQTIFFRLQFHTGCVKGDYSSFRSSDMDKSYNNCHVHSIGSFDLHFNDQSDLLKEHQNALISQNYSIVHQRSPTGSSFDLMVQLQLLDHCLKAGHTLSYTTGPLDGNLYAAISKPTPKTSPKKEEPDGKIEYNPVKYHQDKTSPSIIQKFNTLESQISTAADLINSHKNDTSISRGRRLHQSVKMNQLNSTFQNKSNMATNHESIFDYNDSKVMPRSNSATVRRDKAGFMDLNERIEQSNYFYNSSPYDNMNGIRNHCGRVEYEGHFDELHVKDVHFEQPNTNSKVYDNFQINEFESTNNKMTPFVIQNQHLWYKPQFSRQDAILYLMNLPIGSFVIRQSTSFARSLTLALKCSTSLVFTNRRAEPLEHIKHFIIDYIPAQPNFPSTGYKIRGLSNEKCYPTLVDLVLDHLDQSRGLPVRLLVLSSVDRGYNTLSLDKVNNHKKPIDDRGALSDDDGTIPANNIINNITVYHLGSYITRHQVTEESAKRSVALSVDRLQQKLHQLQQPMYSIANWITKMSLRLTNDRIILTDLNRKMFFRKHIKLTDILCCIVDPHRRVWNLPIQKGISKSISTSPIFGIVSCIPSNVINNKTLNQSTVNYDQIYCQLFCTIDRNTDEYCSLITRAIKHATISYLS